MQTRKYFTFGPEFNVMVDSPMVAQSTRSPSVATITYLITEDNKFLITENGDRLRTES